ncbi:hypothetical protein IVB18_39100 [Bradyrhizobium sp. 186]|uniref:hypothetical protein n=1 Tax=Bradyrhizobium sp. 186 TaxID=2782654 RepID=UPI0020017CC6|nr:hypothetical protein [Bradyrhizobium sp. 186]UPK34105.1 hypothetical protein IVB18_39100 [Bradyrhizobium sp. 186]
MSPFSFVVILSSAVLATDFAFAADAEHHQQASEMSIAGPTSAIVVAEASKVRTSQPGAEKAIIIVSGKQSRRQWIGSRGSKVMLNPQPLPPRETIDKSR